MLLSTAVPQPRRRRRSAAVAAVALSATLLTAADATAMPICDDAGNPCPTGQKTAPGKVDVAAGYTGSPSASAPRSGAPKTLRELA